MKFTFPTMHLPIDILRQTLEANTDHLAGTAMGAPSLKHSWLEEVILTSNQTTWKRFMNKLKKKKRLASSFKSRLKVLKGLWI